MTVRQPPIRKLDSWSHQADAYWFAFDKPATLLAMDMGCVDCETEFLSPDGWIRIDQWAGEMVAQFRPESRLMDFVQPTEYVRLPCDRMIHFHHSRGLDQMLSPEHRVLCYDHNDRHRVFSAREIANREHGTSNARFMSSFHFLGGKGVELSDDEIRLQVAVIADGHFASATTRRCYVNVKKTRKIKRLNLLLNRLGIVPKLRLPGDGFHCFAFPAPVREKEFSPTWWDANLHQRQIICDEAPHWDGTIAKSGAVKFFSTSKASAEFIQFCFVSTGRRASLDINKRLGRKSTDYTVHAVGTGRSGNYIHYAMQNGNACECRPSDGFKYCFQVPSTFLVFRRGGQVFTSGNTGKSKVAVDLVTNWGCEKVLIISPQSVVPVWRREFARHAGIPYDVLCLDKGSVKKRTEQAAKFLNNRHSTKRRVVVINFDAARAPEFAKRALRPRWDCVIIDESRHIKSHKSKQAKLVAKLGLHATRRLCLTGTPMPNSPLDLFGQFKFLDPAIFGTLWTPFRARYAVMGCAAIPQMITKYQNQDELKRLMATISFRVGAEVLDLPPEQHHVRTFAMSTKGMGHYLELKHELITEVAAGVCTVANCLVKSIRLREATSGYIVEDETKTIHRIDDGRQKLLLELLEDFGPGEPVVVFYNFVEDLARIREVAEKLKRRFGEINGQSKDGLTDMATMSPEVDVLGVQIRAGGEGIDLTRARYGIYYSQTYSLGDYLQSLARVNRPGQTRPVNYYHLVAEDTIDVKVREALSKKQEVVDVVLEVFRKGET